MPLRLSPLIVALALALVGVLGGTAVYRAAQEQHREDRENILVWRREALPLVARAEAIHKELSVLLAAGGRPLRDDPARANLIETRGEVQLIRRRLEAAPSAEILGRVRAAYLRALDELARAVEALQQAVAAPREPVPAEIASARLSLGRSSNALERGDRRLDRLVCRARLPDCRTPL